MNTPKLTFEQAALLSRWLSGDRKGVSHTPSFYMSANNCSAGQKGRWIWDWSGGRIVKVWVPASLENEHA